MPSVVFILCVSHKNERNMSGPTYLQIANDVPNSITNGQFKPAQVLSTERELMEQFSVSRVSVRHALKEWVNEYLLEYSHCGFCPDRWASAHEFQG